MEVKKSAQADLERRKPTGFLLGLIVALALLLVALEFTSNPPEESNADTEFDEMAQDYEMMPPEEQQEYEAPAPLVPAPALTERLNIVEEEVATDIKEGPTIPQLLHLKTTPTTRSIFRWLSACRSFLAVRWN